MKLAYQTQLKNNETNKKNCDYDFIDNTVDTYVENSINFRESYWTPGYHGTHPDIWRFAALNIQKLSLFPIEILV